MKSSNNEKTESNWPYLVTSETARAVIRLYLIELLTREIPWEFPTTKTKGCSPQTVRPYCLRKKSIQLIDQG